MLRVLTTAYANEQQRHNNIGLLAPGEEQGKGKKGVFRALDENCTTADDRGSNARARDNHLTSDGWPEVFAEAL